MNIMLALVSICLLCGGVGLFVGLDRAGRRSAARRRNAPVALAAALFVVLTWLPVHAQEVIHARSGTLIANNPAQKTLILKAADGETVVFKEDASASTLASLNKAVREKTVPATGFTKVGSNVVVLYYGYDTPTAVAIKELGPGALKKSIGSVANFDRHDHSLTLKTDAAAEKKVTLNDDTIVDTADGVVKAADYHPSKGQQLRCMTGPASETALLVAPQ